MTIAHTIRAAAIAGAGALAFAGAAYAGPAVNLGAGDVAASGTEATPVHGYGYNNPNYYPGHYYQPNYQPYYQPYYNPYYRPHYRYRRGYDRGYHRGYRRHHGGVYIRTPGLRLGIGF